MKRFAILTAVCCLVSCTSHKIPVAQVVMLPVAPSAHKTDQSVEDVAQSNQKLKDQMAKVQNAAAEAKRQADAATKKAETLAHVGKATQQELNDLWNSMKTTQARNLFLETQLEEQEVIMKKQTELIVKLQKDSKDAVIRAETADSQAQAAKKNYENLAKAYDKVCGERDRFKTTADKASVYRNWVWGLVGGYVLLIVIRIIIANARKTINPAS